MRKPFPFFTAAVLQRKIPPKSCGKPEIDGALVGGASLKADQFTSIVEQTAQIRR